MQTNEFNRTVVGADYIQYKADGKIPPSIDCFLDFINRLKELKTCGEYSSHWYDKEIEAIKYILKIETAGIV
ncbi:MAG: hypothetical protein WKF97_12135 [Chitinophagaceae bacterium]